jgi:hypothetical protein
VSGGSRVGWFIAPTEKSVDSEMASAILIPRWVVYFQAALLGIVATTFFVFGLMVGCLTNNQGVAKLKTVPIEVTGTVQFDVGDGYLPDVGAVVFFLPKASRPDERAAGNLVSPDGFQPLNNPGIEMVNRLGGAVVRTDGAGKFNVTVDGNRSGVDYFILVVSRNKVGEESKPMTKQQVAVIGTFFMPVDRVINERAYYWTSFKAVADSRLATISL